MRVLRTVGLLFLTVIGLMLLVALGARFHDGKTGAPCSECSGDAFL